MEVDGINKDDDIAAVVILLLLFCNKICVYTIILIVAPVSIAYPQLLPNSVSMLNLLFTKVITIPDAMATDTIIVINLWTLGNIVEYWLFLLAGNTITNIKNIMPHHVIEEKKRMYLIIGLTSSSSIMVIIINGKTHPQ
jgi:hypothetical protein